MLISIDHGNKQVKTIHHAPFTSGLVCSEVRPFGGETLTYQGRYYTLTDQRIPYRRDKTEDERFFVLTLFAIAYELEAVFFYGAAPVRVQLAVGLPPAHYGARQKRFAEYFLNRGPVSFTLHDKQYEILIDEVCCYPQAYAAAITVFQTLQNRPRALILDVLVPCLDIKARGFQVFLAIPNADCGTLQSFDSIGSFRHCAVIGFR